MRKKETSLQTHQKTKQLINNPLKMKLKDNNRIVILFGTLLLFTASCAVGPNFKQVELETPEQFRSQPSPLDTSAMFVWTDLFNDTVLTALVDSALINNLDARIAVAQLSEARAYLGMAKADQYPSLSVGGNVSHGNTLGAYPSAGGASTAFSASANLNWELAFWGKYRRATEAARAELSATEYGLRAIQLSLIAEVASAYYYLLDLKNRLEIAERTLDTRKESLRIIAERFDKGIVPEIDLNQAQIQEAIAAASIPVLKRSYAYTENALSVLIGENPSEIITSYSIEDMAVPDSIPIGLPSQLLTRRPDILEAEQLFKAQNARIGVAQAMRFPSISLTGLFGIASTDLTGFNASDALIGSAGASLFGPIFHFGKNKRRVDVERERTEQMRLYYEKAVLSAFRETEDALVNIKTLESELVFVEKQVQASQNAANLSRKRYDGGVTSYLEVLEAERSLFNIELYYSQLLQNRLSAYTYLYKTLGGGWTEVVNSEQ